MLSVYIDTALLAVPNYAVDSETADKIFKQILAISDLIVAHIPVRVVASPMAEECLWSVNCGPSYEQISEFIAIMDLQEFYSAQDVTRIYQIILDHATRADHDEAGSIVEIEEFSNFIAVPPLPHILTPIPLRIETERAFTTVALMNEREIGWLLSTPIRRQNSLAFQVDAQVESLERNHSFVDIIFPFAASSMVHTFESIYDLVNQDMGWHLWNTSSTSLEVAFAITIGALTLRKTSGLSVNALDLKDFSVGPKFYESLVEHQCSHDHRFSNVAYSLCAQIVADLCTRRNGPFGRPDQTVRSFDRARAWRTHLTEGKEGLRLMHWTPGSALEFANVGVKHALEIAHGFEGGQIDLDLCGFLN